MIGGYPCQNLIEPLDRLFRLEFTR